MKKEKEIYGPDSLTFQPITTPISLVGYVAGHGQRSCVEWNGPMSVSVMKVPTYVQLH